MSWEWGRRCPPSPGPLGDFLGCNPSLLPGQCGQCMPSEAQGCVWAGICKEARERSDSWELSHRSQGAGSLFPFFWAHRSRQGLLSTQDNVGLCFNAHSCPARGRRNLVSPSLEALNIC